VSGRRSLAEFSVTDADALLELVYSKPTGQIVVVAGQAVNFWADRYSLDEPRLMALRPFTSRDLDLFGDIANAYRIAQQAHAKLEIPRKTLASPVMANINIAMGKLTRVVQFLRSVRGVSDREITQYAIPFTRGRSTIYFADPITMLKAKIHNLVELPQTGRNDERHVEILRFCVPLFLEREFLAADETDAAARQCLGSVQRVLKLSEAPIARRLTAATGFDWRALIPTERLSKIRNPRFKKFCEHQFRRWLAAR
jgi:hypothetical protein